MDFVPGKLYYNIREVCEIASAEAHVLRFWETVFPALTPPKSRKGQRIYRPEDIELVLEIRKLLYEDGYTIAGARKRMGMRAPADTPKKRMEETPAAEDALISSKTDVEDIHQASKNLKRVQTELENILTLLDRE
ncbi:MAG: MerR family transcriptional regulator [Acidobacteriota bacterium]|jgi:DNA-binding transcriptional MerR regulator|nr:MerR family transcriptional regulator [Acidobacteriota bacterium]